jgi:GT2 family glycosyltransferase
MEDVEFTLRLRRSGPIVLLDPPMSSSPARQIAHGAWRTTGRNLLFLLLFRLGVPAHFLHSWYYRRRYDSDEATRHDLYGSEELATLKEDHTA